MLGYFALSELSFGWLDSYWTINWMSEVLSSCHKAIPDLYADSIWTVYWANGFLLNCLLLSWMLLNCLADLYVWSFYSVWTIYRVTGVFLNRIMVALNFAELSQTLADLYARWFYSIWTVYWVTRVLLNCLNSLPWMLLNCHMLLLIYMKGDFILFELSTGQMDFNWTVYCYLECCWTVTGSSWTLCRIILFYLNCLLGD